MEKATAADSTNPVAVPAQWTEDRDWNSPVALGELFGQVGVPAGLPPTNGPFSFGMAVTPVVSGVEGTERFVVYFQGPFTNEPWMIEAAYVAPDGAVTFSGELAVEPGQTLSMVISGDPSICDSNGCLWTAKVTDNGSGRSVSVSRHTKTTFTRAYGGIFATNYDCCTFPSNPVKLVNIHVREWSSGHLLTPIWRVGDNYATNWSTASPDQYTVELVPSG